MENCFKVLTNSAYSNESGQSFFYYLHGDQYATFLYFFSNNLWKLSGNKLICDKALQLKQSIKLDLFLSYKCEMPDIFYLAHSTRKYNRQCRLFRLFGNFTRGNYKYGR